MLARDLITIKLQILYLKFIFPVRHNVTILREKKRLSSRKVKKTIIPQGPSPPNQLIQIPQSQNSSYLAVERRAS